jgi:hypothetical protein
MSIELVNLRAEILQVNEQTSDETIIDIAHRISYFQYDSSLSPEEETLFNNITNIVDPEDPETLDSLYDEPIIPTDEEIVDIRRLIRDYQNSQNNSYTAPTTGGKRKSKITKKSKRTKRTKKSKKSRKSKKTRKSRAK